MLKSIPFYASLLDRELSGARHSTNSHVLLYGAIEVHSFGPHNCIASNKTLSSDTGVGVTQIARLLKDLKDAGWISYEFDSNNQRGIITPLLNIATPPLRKSSTPPTKNVAIDNSIDNTVSKDTGWDKPTSNEISSIKREKVGYNPKPKIEHDVFAPQKGNEQVNAVINALARQTPTGKLDGTELDNRRRAHNLLQKYNPAIISKAIGNIKGSFYEGNITSVRKLSDNLNALLSVKRKGGVGEI